MVTAGMTVYPHIEALQVLLAEALRRPEHTDEVELWASGARARLQEMLDINRGQVRQLIRLRTRGHAGVGFGR
jgi:hypothetical protein